MKPTNYRWRVVALLFCATTINYIDRQVLAQLKPFLTDDLGISESEYGFIVSAFQAAYAIGMLVAGRFIDKYGTRISYALSISIWSLAGCLHAAATGFYSLAGARFLLAIGESGNFPAAIKTITEWFPKKDRALATGIFNSGSNIGAIVAPPLVTFLALRYSWRMAFLVTGMLGFIWLVFWLLLYNTPKRMRGISAEELEYIQDTSACSSLDEDEQKEKSSGNKSDLKSIFSTKERRKVAIGICICRFIADWPWWFFLFWTPDFLKKTFDLDLTATVVPLMVIYIISDVGSIFGGWLSSFMIKRGMDVKRARALSLLICASTVLPVMAIPYCNGLTVAVAIISLACFSHQAWAANIYTVVSDNFPKEQVGTMTAAVGFCGAAGGIIAASAVGLILEWTQSYQLIFCVASVAYLAGWTILQLFLKRKRQA